VGWVVVSCVIGLPRLRSWLESLGDRSVMGCGDLAVSVYR
jgi:hypothetical protein